MVAAVAHKRLSSQRVDVSEFEADVLEGLRAIPKHVPAKYFYDAAGSQLFERITELPEYYPTRCEISILRDRGADIAKRIPAGAALVEFGSGSSKKARILLSVAPKLAAYVPVDICGEMIEQEAAELRSDFPPLKVLPVTADICKPFELPEEAKQAAVRIGFFPGSTIGNFEPHEASGFLRNAANILGPGSSLIVGADLIKSADVLNAAYNDAQGVTAQFNLNLLTLVARFSFRLSNITRSTIANGIALKCTWQASSDRKSGSLERPLNFAPAKPSIPRTAISTVSSHSQPSRVAWAGFPWGPGPTPTNSSQFRL